MKRLHALLAVITLLGLILTACGGQQQVEEPTTVPPVEGSTEVPPQAMTPVGASPTPVPTVIVPIDIAGPPMTLGSKFEYVDGSTLIAVPGGEFIMGYGGADNPEHVVSVSDFWIYRAKVTNRQFAWCVAAGQCAPPDLTKNLGYTDPKRANDPVVGVNWDQAQAYCSFVDGRLPTEAEWEKTARGPEGNIWPWGDQTPECSLLNFKFCVGKTTDVTEYPEGESYYEALDMAGNAFEWVADWYSPKYYSEAPAEDPLGPELGQKRTVRGSGFEGGADQSISAKRYSLKPIESSRDLGFRCVIEDPMTFAPACEQVAFYGQDAVVISGGPQGQGLSPGCPPLSINQGKYCGTNNTPYTIITFNPAPPEGIIDPGGCLPTGEVNKFICQSETTVSIQAACSVTVTGDPGCSPGYTFDPASNKCVYKDTGWDGECLPGANFDPEHQCCAATAGADASSVFSLCDVGEYYDATLNACFDVPTAGMTPPMPVTVGLLSCTGGGNQPTCDPATDPACQPPPQACQPQSCQTFYNWNPTLCCCYNAFKGGCQ